MLEVHHQFSKCRSSLRVLPARALLLGWGLLAPFAQRLPNRYGSPQISVRHSSQSSSHPAVTTTQRLLDVEAHWQRISAPARMLQPDCKLLLITAFKFCWVTRRCLDYFWK